MKQRKLLALGLAMVLLLSLVTPFSLAVGDEDDAVAFPDLVGHWGEVDCRAMVDAGMFIGYTDGSFGPNDLVTTSVALVLCARMLNLDADLQAEVLAARTNDLNMIFGSNSTVSWAFKEFAICLEAGIITFDELTYLNSTGALTSTDSKVNAIAKQDLAMYMIRAMQLEPLALSQKNTGTNFTDDSKIAAARKPYVYLMYMYAITLGNEANEFDPYSNVNRAVMATMISRSLAQMENRGISVELGEYTDYNFYAGTVSKSEVNSKGETVLTLASELSGESRQVAFQADDVTIYTNNMVGTTSDLKAGEYARVIFDSKNNITAIRLAGGVTSYTGAVTDISKTEVGITSNDTQYTFPISRFTEVKAGDTVGDRSLLTGGTGYVAAICRVDSHGNLVQLQLSGGTRTEWGIVAGVEVSAGTTYVLLNGTDGLTSRFAIGKETNVTVNSISANLTSSYVGHYAGVQISNDDGSLKGLAIDTTVTYVQGTLSKITYSSRVLTIENFITGKSEQYKISETAKLTYEGETLEGINYLGKDTFVTVQIVNGEGVEVTSMTGNTEVTGKLTGLNYGKPIIMTVQRADGVVLSYSIDPDNKPGVIRNGESVVFDKLTLGDEVELSLRYQTVKTIKATAQEADIVGTIAKVVSAQTLEFTINLDNGETVTYSVPNTIPVTQDGDAISIYTLKYGDRVALLLSGDSVSAIELKTTVATTNSVAGNITYIGDVVNNKCTMIVRDATTGVDVTLSVAKSVTITSTTGSTVTLAKLAIGDSVMVYYQINNGVLEATLIIR